MFIHSQQAYAYWESFSEDYIDCAYESTDSAEEFLLFMYGA